MLTNMSGRGIALSFSQYRTRVNRRSDPRSLAPPPVLALILAIDKPLEIGVVRHRRR